MSYLSFNKEGFKHVPDLSQANMYKTRLLRIHTGQIQEVLFPLRTNGAVVYSGALTAPEEGIALLTTTF